MMISIQDLYDAVPAKHFAHFEIIRRNSNMTPFEGPNILMIFFNADIFR